MEDHNSPAAIAARANQEDPLVMYLIVRESINMTRGKLSAQSAHAGQMIMLDYFGLIDPNSRDPRLLSSSKEELDAKVKLFHDWLNSSFRKVSLTADEKEWVKVKEAMSGNMIVVVDAGLTELAPNTETVIGLWPMLKSQRPKIIKKLQALKDEK